MIIEVPTATPVTTPVLDTVAAEGFDECHVAEVVTFLVVPLESVAVAVSWLVWPIDRVDPPVTATETVAVVGDVARPPTGATFAQGMLGSSVMLVPAPVPRPWDLAG